MEWKRYGQGYRIQKEKRSYEENISLLPPSADVFLKNKNENNIGKGSDKVDSGE